MKKITLLLIVVLGIRQYSFSQKIMHSTGIIFNTLFGKENIPGGAPSPAYPSTYNFSITQGLLSYFPKYNFVETSNGSFSIGIPVGVGLSLSSNDVYGTTDRGIAFAYTVATVLDYNFGCKSTKDNPRKFGGYFGAGFDYFKTSISGSKYSNFTGISYGPTFRGGFRFRSFADNWDNHGLTIGFFYKIGLENKKTSSFGTVVYLDI